MADQVQWRGGSRQNSDGFTGAPREVTVDTTDWILRVHDGIKPGGHKMMKVNDCLVVETADKCDPTAEQCKVTINGDLEVDGDTNLGDTIIDGNLVVNGDFVQDGITIAVKTNEVILTNPGPINQRNAQRGAEGKASLCDILPPSGNLRFQEDANIYIEQCLLALENAICDFDLTAIDEIQDIKDDLTKIWAAIAALENRLDQVEIDIADIKARLDLIEQAIGILETEIEALGVIVHENQAAIEALKVAMLALQQEIDDIKDWIKDHSLDDHIDVDLASPSQNDYFVYKNGKWTNEAQCNMKCNTYIPSLATL